MTKAILVRKSGETEEIELTKKNNNCISKCLKNKGIGEIQNIYNWKYNDTNIQLYGFSDGKAGYENKFELPPPVDSELFFGDMVFISCNKEKLNDFSLDDFIEFYNETMGGFEDLDDEDEDEDEEEEEEEDSDWKPSSTEESYSDEDEDEEDDDYEDSEDDDEDEDEEDEENEDEDDDEEEEQEEEEEKVKDPIYIVRGMRGTFDSGYQAKIIEHFSKKEEALKYYKSISLEMYAGKELEICSTKEEIENDSGEVIESEYVSESENEDNDRYDTNSEDNVSILLCNYDDKDNLDELLSSSEDSEISEDEIKLDKKILKNNLFKNSEKSEENNNISLDISKIDAINMPVINIIKKKGKKGNKLED